MSVLVNQEGPVGGRPDKGGALSMGKKGTLYHTPSVDDVDEDILDAVHEAAERVHGVPFRRKVRSFRWFRRLLRRSS